MIQDILHGYNVTQLFYSMLYILTSSWVLFIIHFISNHDTPADPAAIQEVEPSTGPAIANDDDLSSNKY